MPWRIAIFMLASSLTLTGCEAACGNEVSNTVVSPTGTMKAVVFNRNCGATTGFNTQVSVLSLGQDLQDEGGNVLIVDDTVPLVIRWTSNDEIFISGIGGSTIFKKANSAEGVRIRYDE